MIMKARIWIVLGCATVLMGCSSESKVREKIAQIRVWEDQGWTANGRLTGFLSDKSEAVRERAALALGRVNDTLALDSLRRVLLNDPSSKVRGTAAVALSSWVWKVGKNALLEALPSEKDPDALVLILQALAKTYAREEYEQILPFLRHPEARVRAQAAMTLDMINRREVADSIVALLYDGDPTVRFTALLSLIRMNSESAAREALRFITEPDPAVRAAAYRLAGSFRFDGRNETILEGFRDSVDLVRCAVADASLIMRDTSVINVILPTLATDSSPAFIQRALRAAAEHIHADTREHVLPLLRSHPDPTVRAMAVNAVCNRRDTPCWSEIAEAENDPDWRVRIAIFDALDKSLKFLPPNTSIINPMVRRLLNDPAPRVRARALQAYVSYGMPEWDVHLNRLYHDTSSFVVAMAVQLIGTMHYNVYVDSLYMLYQQHSDDPNPDLKWAITAASANMLPGIEIDSLRQDIINWGMSDPNRLVRWYTIAVAFKFRQDRRNELGTYLTDLTVENIDSLLPAYATPPLARIVTTRGAITIELNAEVAPRTVRQFIANAKNGVYDATPVNDVQGGQLVVLGDRWGDESSLPPANVRDEYSHLRAEAGTVMWSLVSRDSGRGNFMIALTRLPYQDWRYPVFGQIREGLDVARSLTMADTVRTIQIITSGIS